MPQTVDSSGRTKGVTPTPVGLVGTLAARPSATGLPDGIRYWAEDTGDEYLTRSGAWVLMPNAPPVGAIFPYAGATDPGNGWLLADGRLVSRITYARFFAIVGHVYNGGVDPGSSQVRLPDKRGRGSVGADNMGTAQGAASRLPNSSRALGQNGGAEQHTLSTTEMPAHTHTPSMALFVSRQYSGNSGIGDTSPYVSASNGFTGLGTATPPYGGSNSNTGGGSAHNNMAPYEVDNWIVRVA